MVIVEPMWTWDDAHESAMLAVPFPSAREATWAARSLSGWWEGSVHVQSSGGTRYLRVDVELAAPDSYSDEALEAEREPERYAARTQAELVAATKKVDAQIAHLGLVVGASPSTPELEARIAETRRDPAIAMPPTRRRDREAITVLALEGDTYLLERNRRADVFCDYRTGEPIAPVPLIVGETYWMHENEIDVAPVDDAAMAALADATRAIRWGSAPNPDARYASAPRAIDLRGFLARELQYGPLDVARARKTLLRGWLEANDALCLDVGEPALTNGKRMIERRRGPTVWEPWTEDSRILVRASGQPSSAT